ncbi:MAG TPA: metallophosphoesterase [Spirochaetota bacterium]|nr:metallophosphoesterase [Spirochaetota bacterium]HOM10555.1 metallophosphoesterase [Spirochaetota bacterium]HPP50334.1 metallophosphoesterase [Spirochaetota bacterium]HXK65000.1 metallophosphoesterase [Spirochaetota bacterium]
MRSSLFYIIFTAILIIYLTANFYVLQRIQKLVPNQYKILTATFISILALSFLLGRILERYTVCAASDFLIWIGALWLGIFIYLFFGFIIGDSIQGIVHIFIKTLNIQKAAYSIVIIVSIIITSVGFINARTPHVKEIAIHIDKPSSPTHLKIAYASDIHLGSIIANSRLQNLVRLINSAQPDLIIFGGDILDEDIKPVIENNLGELLIQLKARYGVIAVPGNHEYIGGIQNAINYIKDHNIRVLRDEVYSIGDIQIIGRDDRSKYAFTGSRRLPLENLIKQIDISKPVIVIDHQPFKLSQTASYPVDFLLSGHSHHGQLFPFNYITKKLYEISWGYKVINKTNVYVSSGYGTWGPPIRTNSYPEIVIFNVYFK